MDSSGVILLSDNQGKYSVQGKKVSNKQYIQEIQSHGKTSKSIYSI